MHRFSGAKYLSEVGNKGPQLGAFSPGIRVVSDWPPECQRFGNDLTYISALVVLSYGNRQRVPRLISYGTCIGGSRRNNKNSSTASRDNSP
jgi:hypothetical protein